MTDSDGRESLGPHLEALFHGRDASQGSFFSIGLNNDSDQLRTETVPPEKGFLSGYPPHCFAAPVRMLKIVFHDEEKIFPWFFAPYAMSTKMAKNRRVYQYVDTAWIMEHGLPTEIACLAMGPELLSNDEIVAFWDVIALTDEASEFDLLRKMLEARKRAGLTLNSALGTLKGESSGPKSEY